MIPTSEDWAWLAGIVDGEGCLQIHERRNRDRAATAFQITFGLGMTDPEPVYKAVAIVGYEGHLKWREPTGASQRPCLMWLIHAQHVEKLILGTFPHLTVKRPQAIVAWNCLQLTKLKPSRRVVPPEITACRHVLKGLIKDMNQRREFVMPEWCVEPPNDLLEVPFLPQAVVEGFKVAA